MSKFFRDTFSRNNTRALLIWTLVFIPIWTVAWSVRNNRFDFGPLIFGAGTWMLYVFVAWVAYKRKWK